MTRVTSAIWLAMLVVVACSGSETLDPAPEPPPSASDAAATPGDLLPDMEAQHFDGTVRNLRDHVGQPMVVNFWASWCPPCVAEMPDLEAVHRLTEGRVRFLGINTQDTPDAARAMVERTGVTYDLVHDPVGQLFRAFEVFSMPTTFYVDANGHVVARHSGLLTFDMLVEDVSRHLGVDVGDTP